MKKMLALVTFLTLAATAQAQTTRGGGLNRLDWPRTFAGQPDFEFGRAEVIADAKGKNAKPVPTLADLLEDVPLDPLGLEGLKGAGTVSGTAEVSGTVVVGAAQDVSGGIFQLPSLGGGDDMDLTGFRRGLQQRLSEYLQNWQPDLRTFELSYLLRNLKLQGVMTSPVRQAIINGTTYRVGEQLKASVTVEPSGAELLNVMEEQIPPAHTLTPAQAAQYREAFDTEAALVARNRQEAPANFQRTFTLPVTVRAIESRKVTLELNGMTYDLSIPFAY